MTRSVYAALLRPALLAGAATLAFTDMPAFAQSANLGATATYAIPSQPAGDALNAFSRQSGIRLLFPYDAVEGKTARPINGQMTAEQALSRLLADTGLRMVSRENGTVTLAGEARGESADNTPFANIAESNEIIVTARKNKESIQDIPISISAFSGAQLDEQGATDIKDVLGRTPGLAFDGQDRGKSIYTIRGVNGGFTTTGVFYDDISVLMPSADFGGATDVLFFDMDRVEVLKGPQGTLYGGSAMGGAIKYVSARPDLGAVFGSGAIGTAVTKKGAKSYNAEGVVNVPLIDGTLGFRGAIYFAREGGYIDNVPNLPVENPQVSSSPFPTYTPVTDISLAQSSDADYNGANIFAARASLLFQPDDGFSIRPFVLHQDTSLANTSEYLTYVLDPQPSLQSSDRITPQQQSDRFTILGLDVFKRLGAVEITSLTGYFHRKFVSNRDYSFFVNRILGFPFDTNSFAPYATTQKTFSEELRFSSAAQSTSPLKWLLGLYYSHSKNYRNPDVTVYLPPDDPFLLLDGNSTITRTEHALFGEVSYRLFDILELTAGARVFKIKTDNADLGTFFGAGTPTYLTSKEDGISPKFTATLKPSPDHTIYASAAKGFRPGAPIPPQVSTGNLDCLADYAALGLDGPPSSFNADSVWSYELGSKNSFAGGKVRLNGAIFQIDWTDIQQGVLLPSCGSGFTANAGSARIRGADLDTSISITPSFELGGTLSYLDAKITDPGPFSQTFTKGDSIQSAPEWMVSAYSEFRKPLSGDWEVRLRGDYQYRSSARLNYGSVQSITYSDGVSGLIPNVAEFNPGYCTVNLNLTFANDDTSVRFYARNVFNSQPVLDLQTVVLLYTRAQTLRPRTVGVELRQKF